MPNKKTMWKYAGLAVLVGFALPGVFHVFGSDSMDVKALYFLLGCGGFFCLLLLYEYQKVYHYNRRLREELGMVGNDNARSYSYTSPEGHTAFYLDASDVIRAIEAEKDLHGLEGLVRLREVYKDSPKILLYLRRVAIR